MNQFFNVMKVSLILLFAIGCTSPIPTQSQTPIPPTSTLVLPVATSLAPTGSLAGLMPGTVLAGKESAAIQVGILPQLVVVGEGAVWVPNVGSGTLSRIDPETNEVVAVIPIGEADLEARRGVPSRAAVGNGFVWAANNNKNSVVQIDPETNEVVATIPLGVRPFALAVHQETLWITSRVENSVIRVDANTHEVVKTILDVKDPTAVAVSDEAVWIVNHSDDAITRIDPVTNKIVALIPLEVTHSLNPNCGSCVSGITADANAVWVAIAVGGIARIDPQTNQVIAKLITGPGTYGIAGDGQAVWFTNATEQAVLRIDPQTNKITGAIPSSATLSFLTSGEGALWATTEESSDPQGLNQVIRFDLQP